MDKNEEERAIVVGIVDPEIFVSVARAYMETASDYLAAQGYSAANIEQAISVGLLHAREKLSMLDDEGIADDYLYRVLNLGELLGSRYQLIGVNNGIDNQFTSLPEPLLKAAAVSRMDITDGDAQFDPDDFLKHLFAFEYDG